MREHFDGRDVSVNSCGIEAKWDKLLYKSLSAAVLLCAVHSFYTGHLNRRPPAGKGARQAAADSGRPLL